MNLIFGQLAGKVDNHYSVKGAFFDADSTASTQVLRYYGFAVFWALYYAFATSLVHWTVDDAFQPTFLWLAKLLV